MRRAHRLRRHAGGERDRRLPIGLHQRGLEQRRVHPLPAAGLEPVGVGREDSHGGEDAGGDVGERPPPFVGGPPAMPVTVIVPLIACVTRSKPRRFL